MTEPIETSPSQAEETTGGVPAGEPATTTKTQAVSNSEGVKTVKIGGVEVSQDAFDEMIKDRIAKVKDATRGQIEKKYADYDDLKRAKAKLDELELAKLSEDEKAKKRLADLNKRIADKEKEFAEKERELVLANLKDKKRSALDAAKLNLPKDVTISELLDMMPGESDEDIENAVSRFKKMFPEPKSLATGTQSGGTQQAATPDVQEQIATLTARAMDPKTSQAERSAINNKILSLKCGAGIGGVVSIR